MLCQTHHISVPDTDLIFTQAENSPRSTSWEVRAFRGATFVRTTAKQSQHFFQRSVVKLFLVLAIKVVRVELNDTWPAEWHSLCKSWTFFQEQFLWILFGTSILVFSEGLFLHQKVFPMKTHCEYVNHPQPKPFSILLLLTDMETDTSEHHAGCIFS